MPKQRGVSGFWLDIKALENDRTHLIGDHGAKEGMLIYGLWVRLFTWQYKTAAPIRDYKHVARLTGLNTRTAQRLMCSLVRSLPQSLVQRSGQWYCKRTLQVLSNYHKSQYLTGATSDPKKAGDSDSDSDPSSYSSLSQDSDSGDPTKGRGSYSVRNRNFAPFWSSYPIKRGKKRAEAIWKRKDLDKHSEMIIQDVERRKVHDQQWADGYIPNPATYLNQERWEDELESPRQSQAKRPMSNVERLRMEMPEFFGQEEVIDGEVVKKEWH